MQAYTGGCYTVTEFIFFSNCTQSTIVLPGSIIISKCNDMPANRSRVSISQSCEVTVIVVTDCGDSEPMEIVLQLFLLPVQPQ